MNSNPDKHDANQRRESLSLRDSKWFHRARPLAKFGIVHLLFTVALMLLASSTALAQGGKTSSRNLSAQRDTEGATITAKRITLKPGYKFTRVSADTIAVGKKKGGITIKATCSCAEAGKCIINIGGSVLYCYGSTCNLCSWGKIITTPR